MQKSIFAYRPLKGSHAKISLFFHTVLLIDHMQNKFLHACLLSGHYGKISLLYIYFLPSSPFSLSTTSNFFKLLSTLSLFLSCPLLCSLSRFLLSSPPLLSALFRFLLSSPFFVRVGAASGSACTTRARSDGGTC